ncbi:MAG: hypothetical protein K1X66_06290 [Verrucomicrobiae bacterium]|nr:hypothetical protein [Verrucomicrobiae bacterium]
MNQVVKPAPRRKSHLWKVAIWLIVIVIVAQLIWLLSSVPWLRKILKQEKQQARQEQVMEE